MITLNDGQEAAVNTILQFLNQPGESEILMEGSAGTGKTTCIQRVVMDRDDLEFVLTAPTNKATKVLRETSMREGLSSIDCRTIYSLLGLRVQKDSEFVQVEPLAESDVHNYQVVIVDEGSMVNKKLRKFISDATLSLPVKFIFMADPMQLPPVNEDKSDVFQIDNKVVLNKVERHDNQILTLATNLRDCIRRGEYPKFKTDNDQNGGVYTVDHRRMVKHLEKAYTSDAYLNNPNSLKTIAWRNAQVATYNDVIRNAIYGEGAKEMFVVGERVVATHPIPSLLDPNNFDMVTDEEATIMEINVTKHPMFEDLTVFHLLLETEFGEGWANGLVIHPSSKKEYLAKLEQLAQQARDKKSSWAAFWKMKNEFFHDIRPCHAITAHRSQGSTYRSVFVDVEDIMSNYNTSEALRCLYVACTRASDILVLKTR